MTNGNPTLDADHYWTGTTPPDEVPPAAGDAAGDHPAADVTEDPTTPPVGDTRSRDLDDYAVGGGWFRVGDEKAQGRVKGQALLDAWLND